MPSVLRSSAISWLVAAMPCLWSDLIASRLLLELAHCTPLSPQSMSSHLISSGYASWSDFRQSPALGAELSGFTVKHLCQPILPCFRQGFSDVKRRQDPFGCWARRLWEPSCLEFSWDDAILATSPTTSKGLLKKSAIWAVLEVLNSRIFQKNRSEGFSFQLKGSSGFQKGFQTRLTIKKEGERRSEYFI